MKLEITTKSASEPFEFFEVMATADSNSGTHIFRFESEGAVNAVKLKNFFGRDIGFHNLPAALKYCAKVANGDIKPEPM